MPAITLRIERVVGSVHLVDITANGTLHFAGQGVDSDLDAQRMQTVHELPVKCGHRTGDERQRLSGSLAGTHEEVMFEEVKRHVKGAAAIGNGRGGQPTRGDVQGDMPPVVEERREFQADFAHDLRPQVQRLAGVSPCLIGQSWPECCSFAFACVLCRVYAALHLVFFSFL
jgi:hypothetical protein